MTRCNRCARMSDVFAPSRPTDDESAPPRGQRLYPPARGTRSGMSTAEERGLPWSHLVNGLLDARADLATERFDAELAVAVAAGDLTAETAHRLRFWQRASVNAVDD